MNEFVCSQYRSCYSHVLMRMLPLCAESVVGVVLQCMLGRLPIERGPVAVWEQLAFWCRAEAVRWESLSRCQRQQGLLPRYTQQYTTPSLINSAVLNTMVIKSPLLRNDANPYRRQLIRIISHHNGINRSVERIVIKQHEVISRYLTKNISMD